MDDEIVKKGKKVTSRMRVKFPDARWGPGPLLEGKEKFVLSFLAAKARRENRLHGVTGGETPKPVSEQKPKFSWNKRVK